MTSILRNLRERIAQIEGFSPPRLARTCPTGWPAVDAALPGGGLLQGGLHEIHSPDPADGAAVGFALRMIGRFQSAMPTRMALWVSCRPDLFPPGAKINPSRLIMAKCQNSSEVLFALEESFKSKSICVIFGDIGEINFSLSRRLQLAAAETGSTLLLLRPSRFEPVPSAAATRWRAECRPGGGWSLSLFRCRSGQPGHWHMWQGPGECS